eukprot:Hpha_TRINITY_DN16890_c0_g4::TRINITY_DN16890_c0_g4_i1::g.153487::m.153487
MSGSLVVQGGRSVHARSEWPALCELRRGTGDWCNIPCVLRSALLCIFDRLLGGHSLRGGSEELLRTIQEQAAHIAALEVKVGDKVEAAWVTNALASKVDTTTVRQIAVRLTERIAALEVRVGALAQAQEQHLALLKKSRKAGRKVDGVDGKGGGEAVQELRETVLGLQREVAVDRNEWVELQLSVERLQAELHSAFTTRSRSPRGAAQVELSPAISARTWSPRAAGRRNDDGSGAGEATVLIGVGDISQQSLSALHTPSFHSSVDHRRGVPRPSAARDWWPDLSPDTAAAVSSALSGGVGSVLDGSVST